MLDGRPKVRRCTRATNDKVNPYLNPFGQSAAEHTWRIFGPSAVESTGPRRPGYGHSTKLVRMDLLPHLCIASPHTGAVTHGLAVNRGSLEGPRGLRPHLQVPPLSLNQTVHAHYSIDGAPGGLITFGRVLMAVTHRECDYSLPCRWLAPQGAGGTIDKGPR